jgi:mannose-6-phosphate isomerase
MWQLTSGVRFYPWGSRTVIPELLGQPTPADRPYAELWVGAHPDEPSLLPDGRPLNRAIAADPEALLGRPQVERFGPRLPFLLKVLAAETPLSLQAHPTAEQAEAGFAAEEAAGVPRDDPTRTFKDPCHKPELLLALTTFEALCGFRPVEVSRHGLAKRQVSAHKPCPASAGSSWSVRSPRRPAGSWRPTTPSSSTPIAGPRRWPRPTPATRAWSSR